MKNLILIIALAISTSAFSQDTFFLVNKVSYCYFNNDLNDWGEWIEGSVSNMNSNLVIMGESFDTFLIPTVNRGNVLIKLTEVKDEVEQFSSFGATYTVKGLEPIAVDVVVKDTGEGEAVLFIEGGNLSIAFEIEYHSKKHGVIQEIY
tara:strand:+ start:40 stop:483 length:444 start_codon:yes stop_codon:yes gene_type:complete